MKTSRDIIIRPIITEKSMTFASENKYTFEVQKEANKKEIGKAIEDIFKVKVTKVNTLNIPGKFRRYGRYSGLTRTWKKAVVTLKAGDKIEVGGVSLFEQ